MALVSVILPTYDRAGFVGGAIETALGQSVEEIEVVVVDGGSTDRTHEVLRRYDADERVSVISAEGRGIAASRNLALDRIEGEFVCPLDDDDRWHPRKVETQLALMEGSDREPDDRASDDWASGGQGSGGRAPGDRKRKLGVVYTGGVARRNGRVVQVYRPGRSGVIYPEILADFGLNPYSSHMIRAECFERVGRYDTDLPRGEDWDHCVRIAREYEYDYVPDLLVERRLHEGNVSRAFEDTLDIEKVREKHADEIERYPAIESALETKWYRTRSRVELERGNRPEAIRHALRTAARTRSAYDLSWVPIACLGPNVLRAMRRVRNGRPASAVLERRLLRASEREQSKSGA